MLGYTRNVFRELCSLVFLYDLRHCEAVPHSLFQVMAHGHDDNIWRHTRMMGKATSGWRLLATASCLASCPETLGIYIWAHLGSI